MRLPGWYFVQRPLEGISSVIDISFWFGFFWSKRGVMWVGRRLNEKAS